MALTFESVDEILKCDHSNESYSAVLANGAVYYAVKDCKLQPEEIWKKSACISIISTHLKLGSFLLSRGLLFRLKKL